MIITWFKTLTIWQKITTFLILVIFLGYQIMSLRYEYVRHQWIKQIHKEKTIIEEKKKVNEKTQDEKINDGEVINKKYQTEIKKTREKSKKDAEAIDNSVYSNSKLDSLLANYDKRS